MPTFEIMSAGEAHLELALRGSRGEVLREYIGYIEQVDDGHAGKLTALESETTAAVRRRLGGAPVKRDLGVLRQPFLPV